MRITKTLAALAIASLPLLAGAQTANTPGGSASTGTPLDQTKGSPQATTPKTTATTPDTTNPSGSTTHGKSPMSNTTDSTDAAMAKSHGTKHAMTKGTNTPPPGDVPTYPAPTRDGTPTK